MYLEVQCGGGERGAGRAAQGQGDGPVSAAVGPRSSKAVSRAANTILRLTDACLPTQLMGKAPVPAFPRVRLSLRLARRLRARSLSVGTPRSRGLSGAAVLLCRCPQAAGPVAVYTWEGNQVNITCEVFAYPSATISWFRDGQLLPSSTTATSRSTTPPSASYLEVSGVWGQSAVQEAWSKCGQAGYS